jgi:hypothetical protein
MQLHYQIAGDYKAGANLIGSNTGFFAYYLAFTFSLFPFFRFHNILTSENVIYAKVV